MKPCVSTWVSKKTVKSGMRPTQKSSQVKGLEQRLQVNILRLGDDLSDGRQFSLCTRGVHVHQTHNYYPNQEVEIPEREEALKKAPFQENAVQKAYGTSDRGMKRSCWQRKMTGNSLSSLGIRWYGRNGELAT